MRVKLTNPSVEPFTHAEFAKRGDKDVWIPDEDGSYPVTKSFKKGDVMDVSKETAAHLIVSGQAELVNAADAGEVFGS